ncbi:MAG: TetR/AcrR family transcriptional regulator, partial [Pseudomonadota bacterium]
MARPRQFEPEAVREAIMLAFLKGGFDGTSLSDLEAATGLGRRSLYNTFGDKQAMFSQALTDFEGVAVSENLAPLLRPEAGLSAIADMLNRLLGQSKTPEGRLGCLFCNTARETVANEPPIRTQVAAYFARVESAFKAVLDRAQATGELDPGRDTAGLAAFFLGVVVGLSVMGRAQLGEPTLSAVIDEALA